MKPKKKYDDPLAAPEGLAKHWAFHGAKLERKEVYRSQEIFLADGGPHFDARKFKKLSKDEQWMKQGYFVSCFAIQRGKAFFGYPLYFEIGHDLNHNNPTRQQMRLNAALAHAKSIIDDGIDRVDPPIFQEHSIIAVPKNRSRLILPRNLH